MGYEKINGVVKTNYKPCKMKDFQPKKCRIDPKSVLKILWIVESIAPFHIHILRNAASSGDCL